LGGSPPAPAKFTFAFGSFVAVLEEEVFHQRRLFHNEMSDVTIAAKW